MKEQGLNEGFHLFLKFHQNKEYLEKAFGLWSFWGHEKSFLFSLFTSSICFHPLFFHPPFFFSFVWFCLQTRAVNEEVGVVLVNCIELIFVRTGIFCDVRGVNVKA